MSSFFGTSSFAVDSLNTTQCTVTPHDPFSLLGTVFLPSDEQDIRRSLRELVWLSYRSGFPPIGMLTCDGGWGCMYRTAQMALANAMVRAGVGGGRGEVLCRFLDTPAAPFSLHALVSHSQSLRKKAGDWLCPSEAAYVISTAVERQCDLSLAVHIARNGLFSLPDITAKAAAKGRFSPTLLIAPIRLGLDNVNPLYLPSIKGELRGEKV